MAFENPRDEPDAPHWLETLEAQAKIAAAQERGALLIAIVAFATGDAKSSERALDEAFIAETADLLPRTKPDNSERRVRSVVQILAIINLMEQLETDTTLEL